MHLWTRIVVGSAATAALVGVTSCSVQRVPLHDPQGATTTTTHAPYDPQKEAASPPPPAMASGETSPAAPNLDVPEAAHLDAPPVAVQDLPAPAAPRAVPESSGQTPSASQPSLYRVQVFATTDRDAAERMQHEVEARTGMRTTLAFQSPYYKVRVGECPTSEACRDLQDRLRASGYDTVWVVSDAATP